MLRQLVLATAAALTLTLSAKADTLISYDPGTASPCYDETLEAMGHYSSIYDFCVPEPVKAEDLSHLGAKEYRPYMLIGLASIESSKNFSSKVHLSLAYKSFAKAAVNASLISKEHKVLRDYYRNMAIRAAIAAELAMEYPSSARRNFFLTTGLLLDIE